MTGHCRRLYLELLKKALLNELYLDHEMQILYLIDCLEGRERPDGAMLAHVVEHRRTMYEELAACRLDGRPFRSQLAVFAHSMIGRKRLDHLEWCLETVVRDGVAGDFLEAGVWRGGACVYMRGFLEAHEIPERSVWAADSFAGLPVPSHEQDRPYDFSAGRFPELSVSLDTVREIFARYGLLDDRVRFLQGWFKDTLPSAPIQSLALLRADGDLYESTWDVLTSLYDRVSPGGIIVIDDYEAFPPCRAATDRFRGERRIAAPLHQIDWTGVWWRKESGTAAG